MKNEFNWSMSKIKYFGNINSAKVKHSTHRLILETKDSFQKIQKRGSFYFHKIKKVTPNLTSPYLPLSLIKQIFEKK